MKMMVVGHAAEVPAADQQNATVVSITADGRALSAYGRWKQVH